MPWNNAELRAKNIGSVDRTLRSTSIRDVRLHLSSWSQPFWFVLVVFLQRVRQRVSVKVFRIVAAACQFNGNMPPRLNRQG